MLKLARRPGECPGSTVRRGSYLTEAGFAGMKNHYGSTAGEDVQNTSTAFWVVVDMCLAVALVGGMKCGRAGAGEMQPSQPAQYYTQPGQQPPGWQPQAVPEGNRLGQPPVYGPQPPAQAQPSAPQAAGPPIVGQGQVPQAPFRLTPQEEAQLDRILNLWEQRSSAVKNFSCSLKRWEYDPVFGPPDRARFEDLGRIQYAAPDKGLFEIFGERAEKWVCDGKSVYEYNFLKKQVIEWQLPPELQGRAIANSPLPFLFGARAAALKQRYFLRIITPPDVQGQQTWLEAYPRFQQDAANFRKAELILTNRDMMPMALKLYSPNGKNSTSYQFYEIVVNDIWDPLKPSPFVGRVPVGWTKIQGDSAAQNSARPATGR